MMSQLVCMQVRFLIESFIAALEGTNKRFLSSVDPHVSL